MEGHRDPRSRPHAVYRHWSAEGELLYIGATGDPEARWKVHRFKSSWAKSVAKITYEWFPDFRACRRAEREAIVREGPRHNRAKIVLRPASGALSDKGGVPSTTCNDGEQNAAPRGAA